MHRPAPFAKRKGRERAKRCERGMHRWRWQSGEATSSATKTANHRVSTISGSKISEISGFNMKVTQIRSFPVRDVDGRLYFIVRVDTDAGIYGLGEVGVSRLGRSIAIAIDHLSEIVIGSDPWETRTTLAADVPRPLLPCGTRLLMRHQRHRHRSSGISKRNPSVCPFTNYSADRPAIKSSATPTAEAIPPKRLLTTV